jgi:predicted GNAT superfamily acetyltransferase
VTGLPRALSVNTSAAYPVPGPPRLDLEDPRVLVPIPADVNLVMGADLDLAVRWRAATRQVLIHYFSRGYEAREFLRGERVSYYLLAREKPEAQSAPEGGER